MTKAANRFEGWKLTRPNIKGELDEPVIYYQAPRWEFTHDFVLWWLKEKQVKNVILAGAADFHTTKHYNAPALFKPSKNCRERSVDFL